MNINKSSINYHLFINIYDGLNTFKIDFEIFINLFEYL